MQAQTQNDFIKQQLEVICFSFKHLAGEVLEPKDITNAPYALVSHDTSPDPVFNYANNTALKLFEMSWEEFTKLPSRLSAREQERSERARLMQEVIENGFSTSYQGIRVSKTGRLFLIEDTIVCNLLEPKNLQLVGQAALIRRWSYL